MNPLSLSKTKYSYSVSKTTMNSRDIQNLQEAYLSVYEPQQIEEGIRSAVRRLLGGKKKEVEAPKPESRGEFLRRKYNAGPDKSDTSAKRQILNRARARADRDEERYGSSPYTKKVAQQSKDVLDRYLRAGYSKYGADLKHGRGNKARKRAAALQKEEIEWIVDSLIDEGYNLSSYTWDDMYEICSEEFSYLSEETPEERDARIAARRARVREMESQGRVMTSSRRTSERAKQRREEQKAERLEKLANRALADTVGTTRRSSKPMGSESPAPREAAPSANRRLASKVKSDALASKADEILRSLQKEQVDLYDIILSHLLDEGYVDSIESAEVVMVNMSEEWRESIIEERKPLPVGKMDAKAKELKSKFLKSRPGSSEAKNLISRASTITGTRDKKTV